MAKKKSVREIIIPPAPADSPYAKRMEAEAKTAAEEKARKRAEMVAELEKCLAEIIILSR